MCIYVVQSFYLGYSLSVSFSLWWRSDTGELLMDVCNLEHIEESITFHNGYVTIKLVSLKMRIHNTV